MNFLTERLSNFLIKRLSYLNWKMYGAGVIDLYIDILRRVHFNVKIITSKTYLQFSFQILLHILWNFFFRHIITDGILVRICFFII